MLKIHPLKFLHLLSSYHHHLLHILLFYNDYKTTQNYKNEMRRITDSLTGTGDIPRGLKERVEYYSGPHREDNYLFPAEGKGLSTWANMPAAERKKYFESKGVKPSFPIK